LKLHGGVAISGRDTSALKRADVAAVGRGCENLRKHIENIHTFGLPAVVAVNRFDGDTQAEVDEVVGRARAAGASAAVAAEVWARGGEGGLELAQAVVRAVESGAQFRSLYSPDLSIEEKIETIARRIYGAAGVTYTDKARERIEFCRRQGLGRLPDLHGEDPPVPVARPGPQGAPRGFVLPVTDIRAAAGAGYVYPLVGSIMTMPGCLRSRRPSTSTSTTRGGSAACPERAASECERSQPRGRLV